VFRHPQYGNPTLQYILYFCTFILNSRKTIELL